MGDTMAEKSSHNVPSVPKKKTPFPSETYQQDQLHQMIIDEDFLLWYARKGLTLNLDEQWEKFSGKAIANGYKYLNWRQAFINWLTSDFQQLQTHGQKKTGYLSGQAGLAAARSRAKELGLDIS